jgi:hypothetical protein
VTAEHRQDKVRCAGRGQRLPETRLSDVQTAGIEPLIAPSREAHYPSLSQRFTDAPPAPDHLTPVEAMIHRLKTLEGKKLDAQRKHIPEPVFGIISPTGC